MICSSTRTHLSRRRLTSLPAILTNEAWATGSLPMSTTPRLPNSWAYDLGTVLGFAGIAEAWKTRYLLWTDKAHFILTLYEKRVEDRTCPFSSKSWKCLPIQASTARFPCRRATGPSFRNLPAVSAPWLLP